MRFALLDAPVHDTCPKTDKIVRAANQVHNWLGPGPLLGAYREALAFEFALAGIGFWREPFHPSHHADFVCAPGVVVHVAELAKLDGHDEAEMRDVLQSMDLGLGLFLDFTRHALQVRRIEPRQEPRSGVPFF